MSFVHPAFLWALAALAIPVLIHLFQLRRFTRLDFSNVRLLAEVSTQTRARKKVQHWAVLLARLLALTFLVLAFAQPYIPGPEAVVAGQRAVSLYVDDSPSMEGENGGGRLLDQARSAAQQTVMAHGPTDRFQVLTGRFQGREQLMVGRDEALQAAAQVQTSPYARPLSQVLARQREALNASEAPVKRRFLFTDLQRTVTDVANWPQDTSIATVIVPLTPSRQDNLSVDSVWFDSPVRRAGQAEVLHVRITNRGEQDLVNVPLRLTLRGRQRALATFGAAAGATVDTTLRFTADRPGVYWGTVSVDDRPVVFDDRIHLAYRVSDRIRVLLVSGGDAASDRAIAAVFEGDSLHRFTQSPYRALDLAALGANDLVILNGLPEVPTGLAQALATHLQAGGSLCVFPPVKDDPAGHAALFTQVGMGTPQRGDTARMKVDRIDLEQPFYRAVFQTMPRNVDLPLVGARWNLRPPAGSDVLLRLQDGSPYLSAVPVGRGRAYLWSAGLTGTAGTLMRHALFATSLLRMGENARPMGTLYHELGSEAVIPLEGLTLSGEQPPTLRGPEGVEVLPEVRRSMNEVALVLHDQDLPDGAYAVTVGADTVAMVALVHPRSESDLATYSVAELEGMLAERGLTNYRVLEGTPEDLSLRLTELDQGRKLWKWAVLLALLFLIAEVLLIRWKR